MPCGLPVQLSSSAEPDAGSQSMDRVGPVDRTFRRVPGPETPEVATGIVSDLDFDRRCAMKQMASMFRRACPDLSSTTDLVVAEEDLVVDRRTARARRHAS